MRSQIPEFIHAEVTIREPHTHRTWRATLPNGKIVMAFLDEDRPAMVFESGTRLQARLSVTDFSRAEIVTAVMEMAPA